MFNREKMHPLEEKLIECITKNDITGATACITSIKETKQQPIPTIDAQDAKGYTSLMKAAARCNKEMVELLLKHGAAINLTNKDNLTVLDIMNKFALNYSYLANNMPSETPDSLQTRMIKRAEEHISLIKILIAANAESPNVTDEINKIPGFKKNMPDNSELFDSCVELLQSQVSKPTVKMQY